MPWRFWGIFSSMISETCRQKWMRQLWLCSRSLLTRKQTLSSEKSGSNTHTPIWLVCKEVTKKKINGLFVFINTSLWYMCNVERVDVQEPRQPDRSESCCEEIVRSLSPRNSVQHTMVFTCTDAVHCYFPPSVVVLSSFVGNVGTGSEQSASTNQSAAKAVFLRWMFLHFQSLSPGQEFK